MLLPPKLPKQTSKLQIRCQKNDTHGECINIGNIVLTIVKLEDLKSFLVIGLRKVQTQNLLFTFTWNVKKVQNNFVPIFNSKVGV